MWNKQQTAETQQSGSRSTFSRSLALVALMTGVVLGTATLALAAPDRDNNPPGPRGGAGTNWENPPGPRGGPGASPDAKPWRPWVWKKIFDNDNNPPGPRGGAGTNWENPPGPRGGPGASPNVKPWRPAAARRIHNARHPVRPPRFRPHPRVRAGVIRRR